MKHTLISDITTYEQVMKALGGKLAIDDDSRRRMSASYEYLQNRIKTSPEPIYGVNTGFGALCNTSIDPEKLEELQINLLRSHAIGIGRRIPSQIARIILLLKIKSLSLGYSAVSSGLVDRLLYQYNNGLNPVIYEYGSLGASGDLAPLAHLALPLIGEGELEVDGHVHAAADVLGAAHGLLPLILRAKEGLALLNGTQFMAGYGVHLMAESHGLLAASVLAAALSCEVFQAGYAPFNPLLHQIRPQHGQATIAMAILSLRAGSNSLKGGMLRVQDPYSFRCIPQVLGASYRVIKHVEEVVNTEVVSVTDNPNVFADDEVILSGGNFHGQPLALSYDYLAMALAEIGNFSERRTFQLLSGPAGLPMFLASNPGLESGMMIPQYAAAGLVSANKQLCTPASVDSITSSNGQEDHVSMGANAALKAHQVAQNLWSIIGVEWMTAIQALSLQKEKAGGAIIHHLASLYRDTVNDTVAERSTHKQLIDTVAFLQSNAASFLAEQGIPL